MNKLPGARSVDIDGVKHYEILYNGDKFLCEPAGSKWRLVGTDIKGTLKKIKEAIVSGEVECENEDEVTIISDRGGSIWECINPCALLMDRLGEIRCQTDLDVMATLDSFGWLNEDGTFDQRKLDRALGKIASIVPEMKKGREIK
jgi:hypothetical protein